MKAFVAYTAEDSFVGGWFASLWWATTIAQSKYKAVKVAKLRPEERNAILVAEVTHEGVRMLPGDRYIKIKSLLKDL